MKRRIISILLMIITLLLSVGCSSATKNVSVDESFSGKEVEITVGGTLTVTLESNATTGYSWALKQIGDTSVLQKTGNKYEAPTSRLIGAGGKEVWTFKALKTGMTTLSMEYSQAWAGGQKGARTFNLTVTVK